VIGSRPPWSQVACKLISPFPSPPHSKIPTSWGFPELNMRLAKTTLRIRLPRSGTIIIISFHRAGSEAVKESKYLFSLVYFSRYRSVSHVKDPDLDPEHSKINGKQSLKYIEKINQLKN
jgi:hypothetical protein